MTCVCGLYPGYKKIRGINLCPECYVMALEHSADVDLNIKEIIEDEHEKYREVKSVVMRADEFLRMREAVRYRAGKS